MCAPAVIPAVTLAISAVSTVASIGMGVMSAQAQSQQAQASLNMQAQQAQNQQEQQRQQMQFQQAQANQQQLQQRQSAIQQQKQAQDQLNLSVVQQNAQIQNQYNQQRRQVDAEREQIQKKYMADRLAYQRDVEGKDQQVKYNNEAANRVYVQEQTKVTEAKKKAAFARQDALAKSIGSKGAILSAGRTGQSVGLLVNDAERQEGFAKAQADATLGGVIEQSAIGMDQAYLQAQGANNQADSSVGLFPDSPFMPKMPGIPTYVDPTLAFGGA